MLVVRCRTNGLAWARRGGDELIIPVVEVGIGVGYLVYPAPLPPLFGEHWRFAGRGKPGEDERGSKAGRRLGAGRLRDVLSIGGRVGREAPMLSLLGLSSIIAACLVVVAALLRCGI